MRSGKQGSSTAYTHGRDFDYLLGLKEFDEVVKHENAIKPIGMFFLWRRSRWKPKISKNIGRCYIAF